MLIGLVKWFDQDKGFGVIGTPEGDDYFLHKNNFVDNPGSISRATPLVFDSLIDNKKNRKSAVKARLVGEIEDWELALSYLGKSDSVNIEVEVLNQTSRGNTYHTKEEKSFSLLNLGLMQFFSTKYGNEISKIVTKYFDDGLDLKLFTNYCERIENAIATVFPSDLSNSILDEIYCYFGKNLNKDILFQVWKDKKFRFISYEGSEDYEIPESVLNNHIDKLGLSELRRIKQFSFGSKFCTEYFDSFFSKFDSLSSEQIDALYPIIETFDENEEYKAELNRLYYHKVTSQIIEKSKKLRRIKGRDELQYYLNLRTLIPNVLSDTEKDRIEVEIKSIINSRCTEDFKAELWIDGIIDNLPFETISEIFLQEDTEDEKKTAILSKLNLSQQFELIKLESQKEGFERAFISLEDLIKQENSFGYSFKLSEKINNPGFLYGKKGYELFELFMRYFNTDCNDEEKYRLFFKGYVEEAPISVVRRNIGNLQKEECKKLIGSQSLDTSLILDVLQGVVTGDDLKGVEWVYDLASEYLGTESYNILDTSIFQSIEQVGYFTLWEKGKGKIFPGEYVQSLLNDKYESYKKLDTWVNSNLVSREEIEELLTSYLHRQVIVTDRIIFHKQFNHIKYLLESNGENLHRIKLMKNDFYEMILWFLGKEGTFDFDFLKLKFIYFLPDEQVKIVRKLFSLKANGEFDLTVEKLNDLTRFDLDLYKTSLALDSTLPIDISTDVIIKALASYQQEKRFFVETELLSVIFNDLKLDKTRRFKLSHYFEDCTGRQTAKFDWSRKGEISKIKFGVNQFYFAISFPTGDMVTIYKRGGYRNVYQANPNFEILKDAVKTLPRVKWNPNEKHWGVPAQYESEVLAFAREHRFFLDFEGSNYANNPHLAEFKRQDVPAGISFCEGRLSNKRDEVFNKEFYWCQGDKCYERCESIHAADDWQSYTLLDFLEILNVNTDSEDNFGNVVQKGRYYEFIGFINRFNRLLEHLYCSKCDEMLYPAESGWFTVNNVIRFKCCNSNCEESGKEIYLNHCLNGKCKSIIDSRISKRCNNDVFICESCGSCCSHAFFGRRLNSINVNDILDNPKKLWAYNETKHKYDNKLGHLEKGEYFCHNCGNQMNEVNSDIFHCNRCDIKYDTVKYRHKRPHKYLKQTNMTRNSSDEGYDFDFPF